MIAAYYVGRPVATRRPLEQLVREGYARNVIVYACVWLTARAAAQVPLDFVKRQAMDKGAEVEVPKLAALLSQPNPVTDGASFLQALYSDMMVFGELFAEKVTVASTPRELYRREPDRFQVIPGRDGLPMAYRYTANGQTFDFPTDIPKGIQPILHLRDYNPIDYWRGLSPLEPAAFSVDSHTGSEAWNKALIDNGAAPSGALVYAPKEGSGRLSDDQWNRLKVELDQSFSGAANAGKPLLLDGGLTWQALGMSPKDMDFVNGKNSSARDIALAMGVPPMILGIPGDNTYSNYQEANKAWYRQTILPLVWQVSRGLTGWICPAFGQSIAIEPDIDDLPVFSDERAAAWQRIATADFLTVNEKREALGFAPRPEGNVILTPASMVPLEDAGASITTSPGDGENVTDSGDAEAGDIGDDQ